MFLNGWKANPACAASVRRVCDWRSRDRERGKKKPPPKQNRLDLRFGGGLQYSERLQKGDHAV